MKVAFCGSSGWKKQGWLRWKKLWSIRTAPRVKHFLWLLFKGLLSTYEFLYSINLGYKNPCSLYGIHLESIEHLFLNCTFAQGVWSYTELLTGHCINFSSSFSAGFWLTHSSYSAFVKSVIAAVAWHIWKAHCQKIFWNTSSTVVRTAHRAFCFVKDYFHSHTKFSGKRLLLNNFTTADGLFLFTITSFCSNSQVYNARFFCATGLYNVVFSGSCPTPSFQLLGNGAHRFITCHPNGYIQNDHYPAHLHFQPGYS